MLQGKETDLSIRGVLTENAPLGEQSWFRCGGSADLLFEPADLEDLVHFLEQYPASEPLMVLGSMANCIIRDGGIRGCVIRLGKPFSEVDIQGTKLLVDAGALNGTLASNAAKAGLGGLEFLSGVPGTIGGAIRMNAGAYGSEVKDVLVEAHAIDRQGRVQILKPTPHTSSPRKRGSGEAEEKDSRLRGKSSNYFEMSYRHTNVPEDYIFTHAVFEGQPEDHEIVRARLKEIKAQRQDTQPITEKTGGSTFANPEGMKAWELIDKVGGRGFSIGGAQMSEKHCNFMINTGDATAADLEALGEEMRRRVKEELGVELQWEIKRLGEV